MIDMKIPKKTKAELKKMNEPMMVGDDHNKYPYGLQLRFEKDQIEKLPGFKGVKVGDTVIIHGTGKITEVRMSERTGGKDHHSIEVQLEAVDVSQKKSLGKMGMKEFNAAREAGKV